MSSCCGDSHKSNTTDEKEEVEPTGALKKFLWKLGKADAHKKEGHSQESKGCC